MLAVKTRAARGNIVGDVQHDRPGNVPQHEALLATRFGQQSKEAAHVREVVDEGESPAMPAILVGVVARVHRPHRDGAPPGLHRDRLRDRCCEFRVAGVANGRTELSKGAKR